MKITKVLKVPPYKDNNMTISIDVMYHPKSRTRIVVEGSSNLARSSYFFSEEYFLCTDVIENFTKVKNCFVQLCLCTRRQHVQSPVNRDFFAEEPRMVVQHF